MQLPVRLVVVLSIIAEHVRSRRPYQKARQNCDDTFLVEISDFLPRPTEKILLRLYFTYNIQVWSHHTVQLLSTSHWRKWLRDCPSCCHVSKATTGINYGAKNIPPVTQTVWGPRIVASCELRVVSYETLRFPNHRRCSSEDVHVLPAESTFTVNSLQLTVNKDRCDNQGSLLNLDVMRKW